MHPPLLRIGTRGSPLALAQAHEVRDRLAAAFPDLAAPDAIAITVIRTTGDAITDRTLSAIGGKGLFTKEIEQALLDGAIDIAVHSMKDVPTALPKGLAIGAILEREDPRDAFLSMVDNMQNLSAVAMTPVRERLSLPETFAFPTDPNAFFPVWMTTPVHSWMEDGFPTGS